MAGSIYDRGNGKYKLSFMRKGERYNTTVTASDMKEAKELLKKFVESIEKAITIDKKKCTITEFTELYFEHYAYDMLAEECIYNYSKALNNWVLPKIGDAYLSQCTPTFFKKYFTWLSKQISPVTNKVLSVGSKEKIYGIIASVFTCAVTWKLFDTNPVYEARPEEFKRKNKLKKSAVQERCLTMDEAKKLVRALEFVDLKYKIIVHFAIVCGLRRSEILGIKWKNIDFVNKTLNLQKGSQYVPKKGYVETDLKNDTSVRSISLPQITITMLLDYKMQMSKYYDNDYVFLNDKGIRTGKRMNPVSVTNWFKKFRDSIDLSNEVPLHGLRHTSATILIVKGINIKSVSKRLGHSNTSTTLNIYSHALTAVDKVAGDTLEKILFKRKHKRKIARKKKEVAHIQSSS